MIRLILKPRRHETDTLSVPELQHAELHLMDISRKDLDMVLKLVQRDIEHNGVKAVAAGTTNRREALKAAEKRKQHRSYR